VEEKSVKYKATVLEIGPLVTEFIDAGILVFFGETAPQELKEFSIIHDGKELKADIVPGYHYHRRRTLQNSRGRGSGQYKFWQSRAPGHEVQRGRYTRDAWRCMR